MDEGCVGRNADVLLSEYNPFNIFVCAGMDAKVRRCLEMTDRNKNLSRKELAPAVKTFIECWFRRENEHSIIRSL